MSKSISSDEKLWEPDCMVSEVGRALIGAAR